MALRHVPERTCAGCRQVRPKREMVRIVRTNLDAVEVDLTGKLSGRGTYLCRDPQCWRDALRREALDRTLKTRLGPDDRRALERFAEQLPATREVGVQKGESR